MAKSPQNQNLAKAFAMFMEASQNLEHQYAQLEAKVKALNQNLSDANIRLSVLLDALPAAVVLIEQGSVVQFNRAAQTLLPNLTPGDPFNWPAGWRQGRGPDEYEFDAEGAVRTLQVKRVDVGARSVLQIQDISANLSTWEDSQRTERLAAMGQMSAGIAHQIRTPLSTALLYASHLCETELDTATQVEFSGKVYQQLSHLNRLANAMLQFIKAQPQEVEWLEIHELVQFAFQSAEPLLREKNVRTVFQLNGAEAWIQGERQALISAILSILENAAQVCNVEGEILISSHIQEDQIVVSICDDGPGIPLDFMNRIFEPFATSRSNGTGLGLAIARTAIVQHRGNIQAQNLPERGAQFSITLPCYPAPRTTL